MTVLSVLSVLRCCDFSIRRCRCRRKEIKMFVIAVAWFFQINFSNNETPVSYEPRQIVEAFLLASTERDIL